MGDTKFPRLLIATGTTLTVAGATSVLTSGQVAFYNASTNGVMTAAGDMVDSNGNAFDIFVAQGTGDVHKGSIKSYPIRAKDVVKVWKKAYSAATAQVIHFGYDGSNSLSLSYECEKEYSLGFRLDSSWIRQLYGNAGLSRFYGIVTPCCADCDTGCPDLDCWVQTQKIVEQINIDKVVNEYVSAVMLTDGTFTASSAGIFTVTNGDPWISVVETSNNNDAGKYDSDGSTFAVGDYIRIGGTGATSPVYQIVEVGGSVNNTFLIKLNMVYQGATGTVAAANVGAMTLMSTCGIKVTGKFISLSSGCACEPLYPQDYEGVLITGLLGQGFDCADPSDVITYTTDLVLAHGTGLEVVYLENEINGYTFQREFFADGRFMPNHVNFASTSTNYDLYYIRHRNRYESHTIQGEYYDTHDTIIAVPTGQAIGTSIESFLNAWVVAEPVSLPTI